MLLYIERWLKAPVQMEDGSVVPRTAGTPQGGVISPLLANLFLHYSSTPGWRERFAHPVRAIRGRHHLSLQERTIRASAAGSPTTATSTTPAHGLASELRRVFCKLPRARQGPVVALDVRDRRRGKLKLAHGGRGECRRAAGPRGDPAKRRKIGLSLDTRG